MKRVCASSWLFIKQVTYLYYYFRNFKERVPSRITFFFFALRSRNRLTETQIFSLSCLCILAILRPVLLTGFVQTLRLPFPRRQKGLCLRKILYQFHQHNYTTAKTTTPMRIDVRLSLSRK